jgi:serine/threonine protein kinase
VPAHAKVCELSDAAFPLALVNPSAGLFRDPVRAHEYDEELLFQRRAAQQAQQVTVRGTRLLAVEEVFCDILQLRNVSRDWQDVALHLPLTAPQFRVAVEPATFRIAPDEVQAVKVSVLLTCTTKQRVTIKASVGSLVADLPTAKLEAELSTLLDFDEIHLIERIGEGSYGVVFAGTWRKQAVAVKMLRQQQFAEQEQADLRAEAKLLTQLLHRNIVQFRGAVFRESQCCLVTELAPHGSLKSVLARFELPWDLVIKLCVDMASGVQFLHTSGIIHRDIKSDNVLVFSLSPLETVCAKLTDFGSARAGKAHIDTTGQIQLGSHVHFSANEGTPIYMSPQLFARTSRPSEASDVYSLGVLFYEVASEREPWADVPFAWNVAKLVIAGQRPTWPEHVVESAPAPFLPLVSMMWAQEAGSRPPLDDVLHRLADCQDAIGDRSAAFETRRNLLRSTQENDHANNRSMIDVAMLTASRPPRGMCSANTVEGGLSALSSASASRSVSFDDMSMHAQDEFNSVEELGASATRAPLLSSSGRSKLKTGGIVPKHMQVLVPQFAHLKEIPSTTTTMTTTTTTTTTG